MTTVATQFGPILAMEDDKDDADLLRLLLKKAGGADALQTFRDGEALVAMLTRVIENSVKAVQAIVKSLDDILPRKKKTTALEEAMYEQPQDSDHGFGREALQQEFERSRIFRPRLLIAGKAGMGQDYLSTAVLHHMEGVHVQNFDLATLLGDGRVSCPFLYRPWRNPLLRHKISLWSK